MSGIEAIFNPRSVALIGATATEGKWGYAILKGIIEGGYQGKIYPVNPKGGEILGLRAYKSILEIDEAVDLVLIGIRSDFIPQTIKDCNQKGVKAAVIISAGFAEIGAEGRKLQEEVLKNAGGVRIIGPNVFGLINMSVNLNASYLRPLKGHLALLSQGGNVAHEVEYIAGKRGLGFTQIISIGNRADVGICDLLESAAAETQNKAILLYIEGFSSNEGRRFLELAREITKSKPVIAIKAGVTEAGAKAVSSHTGSLAGKDVIYNAAFKQAGVIRVRDAQEIVDVAEALTNLPPMQGKRFAILTDGGSHATMACDAAAQYGLELAILSDETQQKLKEILFGAVSNPVDFAGAMDADVRVLKNSAAILLQDENVDGLMVAGMDFGGYSSWWGSAEEVEEGFTELPRKYSKPMVLHNSILSEDPPALKTIRSGGVPVFTDVERAMRTLSALAEYGSYLRNNKK